MISIIDIGSNTIRMNVYQIEADSFSILFSSKEMAGLAASIEKNKLTQAGLSNLIRILKQFKETIVALKIEEVYAFATASLRMIENQTEVLAAIQQETGFKVNLIEGEEEGLLGLEGALSQIMIEKAVLLDLGGGSCEIVPFDHHKIYSSISYPLGSLSLYRQFVKNLIPTLDEQKAIMKHAKKTIKETKIKSHEFKTVLGVGGTMRALVKASNYINGPLQSKSLKIADLKKMLDVLNKDAKQAQDILLKVVPDRVHTLIPGLCVILAICDVLKIKEIVVSNNGVREGYLLKHVLKKEVFE